MELFTKFVRILSGFCMYNNFVCPLVCAQCAQGAGSGCAPKVHFEFRTHCSCGHDTLSTWAAIQ